MKGPGRRWQAISYGNRKLPQDNTEKTAAAKAKSKRGRRELGVSRLPSFPYGLFVQQSHAKGGEEKRIEKRKV